MFFQSKKGNDVRQRESEDSEESKLPLNPSLKERLDDYASPRRRPLFWQVSAHVLIFLTYTAVFTAWVLWFRSQRAQIGMPYSPANGVFEYTRSALYPDAKDNPFRGEGRDEQEAAWDSIDYGTYIRVSEEEMRLSNRTSLKLPDGGYLAGLSVHHQLHCVQGIKRYLYADYYYADHHYHAGHNPEMMKKKLLPHVDHCLEVLRQGAMCQGDTSLYTFAFHESNPDWPMTVLSTDHRCANWDRLEEWVMDRAVDPLKVLDYIESLAEARKSVQNSGLPT